MNIVLIGYRCSGKTEVGKILSDVFEGLTTGAPITLFIRNQDADSRPYEILRQFFRPGHADYTYFKKYGHFDFRGGGRYSARETAARVAAGVVAGEILSPLGVKIVAYTLEPGARVEETDDGLIIHGGRPLSGTLIDPHDDHRLAMSQAVVGLRVPGIRIREEGCVNKSFSRFWELWDRL